MSRSTPPRLRRTRAYGAAAIALAAATALSGCSASSHASASSTINIALHDNPSTTMALKQMTTAFEKANPSIRVNLSFISTNDYPAARTSRLAAKKVDIVEGGGGGPAAVPNPSYTTGLAQSDWVKGVDSGQWVNLTSQSFVKNFTPSVIKALEVNGKLYQIPTATVDYTGVFYNKDLFSKAHVEVPKTWSQFVNVMKKLKAAGITPISAGGKDQWPVGLSALALMRSEYPTVADMQALDKGLWNGSASLNDPKMLAVANKLKTIYSYTDPQFAGIDYATAEGQFTGGQAAMTVDGTWAVQQFATQNPALHMGYFPLPGSDKASENTTLEGKIDGLTFAIPTSSTHKAAAEKWISWFADPTHYAEFAKTGGVLPVESGVNPDATLKKVLGSKIDSDFEPAWDQIFHDNPTAGANVGGNGINYVGLAPLGKYTTAQSAQSAAESDWKAGLSK